MYHAARERTPEARAALLRQADPELRGEVESLLAQDALPGPMESPAVGLLEDSTLTQLAAGAQLGPYRIEAFLGAGGMGQVYCATDTRLGRQVAIKTSAEHFSDRFEREARAIAALNHPNICMLYDVGPDYLVMELVEGETLAERLKKGALPAEQALRFGIEIAGALAEAHARGIVHRDLKPGNIMITRPASGPAGIKVLDFGLAKMADTPGDTLTETRQVMGTPAYMAPEQREGQPCDWRADIYALGLILYEMFTGKRFAPGEQAVAEGLPHAIISKCLEKDRELRYQHAAEIRTDLQRLKRDTESGRVTTGARPGAATSTAKRWKVMIAAAAAVLALVSSGYFYLHGKPKLTDKDTAVLADFTNTTGDPVFDGTLRQGLAIQLEQSPFLKIMDDEQVQQDLQLMSLPAGASITNQIAHDICVRDGAAATIDGSIASLGKNYVVTLKAINCQGGATLAREQVQAEDKEHVLNAVGTAATAMRAKLGESIGSIQKLNRPLEQATTPSLEALRNFTAAKAELSQGRFLAAVPLLERATALDPNFAMAYFFLGVAADNAGDIGRVREYSGKAFALIGRVSEYERENIAAGYYEDTGELYKAIDAYRLGIRNYPREWGFHNSLSVLYIDLGQFEEGLREGQEAARLQPRVEPPYRRQLDAYMCLDRLGEAKELAEKLRTQGLYGARIHQRFLEIAYIEGDQAAAGREIQWYAGKPEEYISLGLQAANRNAHGQRSEASKLYQQAAQAALRRGLRSAAAEFDEANARAAALAGDCQTVRRVRRPPVALAMCGDAAEAEKLARETSNLFPNGTLGNAVKLPEIRAAIQLNLDQPANAVEVLASASPYERAYPEAVYLRGLAYLRLHKGAEAAAEFQKILDHKGASWGSTWRYPNWGLYYSLSYVGLARASALMGDTAKARKAFQDFFALWKDADPDIPILQQAKAEYARLP